jgi:integrase
MENGRASGAAFAPRGTANAWRNRLHQVAGRPRFTPHDLRRTGRTCMAMLGIDEMRANTFMTAASLKLPDRPRARHGAR